ncbi:MAG TPA: hypothetical protein VM011_03035, partial [Gammaproteobacteria bacterium]|nr:hypothetical protein [Gammaproteobacteria bacterium]
RAAPQDIPASRPVLVVSVGCYALVSMLTASLSSGLHDGIRVALLELALLVMFTAGLLYLFKRPARIGQTLAALTGSGSLLGLPTLLLVMLAGSGPAAPLPSITWLLLLLWNLLVNAHIMRHALSSSLALGAGVSVLYILASTQIILAGFPQLAAR